MSIDIAANEKITYDYQYPLVFSKLKPKEDFQWSEDGNSLLSNSWMDYELYIIL